MLSFFLKRSECIILRNGSLLLFFIKWHFSFVSEQTGNIGFVMETWHGPVVPYSSLNSGKSLHFSFPTHFISPKSGIPNSYINLVFLHSSFNLLKRKRI